MAPVNEDPVDNNLSDEQIDVEAVSTKHILAIRHAQSVANEKLLHAWGAPDFKDDESLRDTELSGKGLNQVQQGLPAQLASPDFHDELSKVELVLVSPLTRCLQTFTLGVLPQLNKRREIPILALPHASERVYTISDIGSPASALKEKFPAVDFSLLEGQEDSSWWYTQDSTSSSNSDAPEWRPCDGNQWYAVPGEPADHFANRMKELDAWIQSRPERNIILVAHWGVLRHLTGGVEWRNAEAKLLEWKSDQPHAKVVVQTGEALRSKFGEASKI
jgi:broad specificity phosphatase PhoE